MLAQNYFYFAFMRRIAEARVDLSASVSPAERRAAARAAFVQGLGDALRLAAWRAPRHPEARLSGLAILRLFALVGYLDLTVQAFASGWEMNSLNPYGLNALIAGLAVSAAVLLRFSRVDRTGATTGRLTMVFLLFSAALLAENALWTWASLDNPLDGKVSLKSAAATALGTATFIWAIGASRAAFKPASAVKRPGLRAAAFLVALALTAILMPDWPAYPPRHFDSTRANIWEFVRSGGISQNTAYARAERHNAEVAEEMAAAKLEGRQSALLDQALSRIAPRDPSDANVFTLGLAGWGRQNVFRDEIMQATSILQSRYGLGERTLTLINNPATEGQTPLASMQNLGAALREFGKRMDPDKDLLILVLSSHGSPDGFALRSGDVVDRTLDPYTLRGLLDAAKIRNRVVIVSSCYSGQFVEALREPRTAILTASAADRTSFGCADDRHWTWFGEALFEKALANPAPLGDAFATARATIEQWEREQNIEPSEPQIFVGDALAAQFPDIVGGASAAR